MGLRDSGLVLGVSGSGIGVSGFGFRDSGSDLGMSGPGIRDSGFGSECCVSKMGGLEFRDWG